MKCFRHPESDAVGSCKQCAKGLCSRCVVDVGKGLACKDSCEEYVRQDLAFNANAPIVMTGGLALMLSSGAVDIGINLFGIAFAIAAMVAWAATISLYRTRLSRTKQISPVAHPQIENDRLEDEFKKLERNEG